MHHHELNIETPEFNQALQAWMDESLRKEIIVNAAEQSLVTHFVKKYNGPNKPFTMVWISDAYEQVWGKSKDEYCGKTDYEVWDKEVADVFFVNDHKAILGPPRVDVEPAAGVDCIVVKQRVAFPRLGFKGIAGAALPLSEGLVKQLKSWMDKNP